jgi:serine/alanine adding enzyme
MSSIGIVREVPEREWKRFVSEHRASNIFHTPEMFEVFRRSRSHCPELWGVVEKGRLLALMLPVEITLLAGPMRRLTTRSIAYGSVLCEPGPRGAEALALLLESYKRAPHRQSLFTELRNLAPTDEIQAILARYGFKYEKHLNYLVDLNRALEDIFAGIGGRTRKNLRRALNRGQVICEEATTPQQLNACQRLIQDTYQRAQVPLAHRSLFDSAFEVLQPKGMVRFTLARLGADYAAVSVDLLFRNVIYGWYGGVDRRLGSFAPNDLLTWGLLKWGAENGFHVYDFGGAGRPAVSYGVRDFKAKFGGELTCYGRNTWVGSPFLLNLSRLGYEIYRRFGLVRGKQLCPR